MAYTNPGFNNGTEPYINAANLNALANAVQLLSIENGGTGATTAANARANLGLNTAGVNALVNGNALPMSSGGTGQTTRNGIMSMLGLQTQGTVFQVYSGRDYKTLKGYTGTVSVTLSTVDVPGCIYVGGSGTDDYISFSDCVNSNLARSGNYYLITFFSPDSVSARRIQFVIPEVDNKSVYMLITHGSSTSGWGKLSFGTP